MIVCVSVLYVCVLNCLSVKRTMNRGIQCQVLLLMQLCLPSVGTLTGTDALVACAQTGTLIGAIRHHHDHQCHLRRFQLVFLQGGASFSYSRLGAGKCFLTAKSIKITIYLERKRRRLTDRRRAFPIELQNE